VNFDGVDLGGVAEAEVQAGIAGGLKTRVGADFGGLSQASGFHLNAGAEAIAIGMDTYGLDAKPVASLLSLISKKQRRGIDHVDQKILSALVE